MKVKSTIPSRKFACSPGRIKAEGKKAETPFCYRIKIGRKRIKESHSMLSGRVSVVELHSRVTGRKIGYVGIAPKSLVTKEREAHHFIEGQLDRALKPFNTPELVDEKMRQFIDIARKEVGKSGRNYREQTYKNAWDKILSEAKK